jgi:hypothetical protein
MKKLILAIAALALIASPALAVDWNLYGSSRVQTWYQMRDYGDGLNPAGTDDEDNELLWGTGNGFANNSRFGARVKAENISGRVEVQMKAAPGGDPGSYISTESRLLWGEWDFGGGKLLVGKDYTPVSQFVSGQAYDEDLGLLSIGAAYGNRPSQLKLTFGGLQIALVEPVTGLIANMDDAATTTLVIPIVTGGITAAVTVGIPNPAFTGCDPDAILPKIEAKWGMSMDAFSFNIMGGLQYFEVEDVLNENGNEKDVGVVSWIVGGDAAFNFGPAYIKGAISAGINWSDAAWDITGFKTGGSRAYFDGDDDTKDTDSMMGCLVGGFKFTDQINFEAGVGYRVDDPDLKGLDEDEAMAVYGQAVISLAPGVWLVPEIGYYDYMDDAAGDDEGDQIYLGAKWQIDF